MTTRERATVIGCALGGLVVEAAQLWFWFDRADHGRYGGTWVLWASWVVGLPLVAGIGGALAAARIRAVVLGTMASHLLLVTYSKLMLILTLADPQLLLGEAVLVGLCIGAARGGRWIARRAWPARARSCAADLTLG